MPVILNAYLKHLLFDKSTTKFSYKVSINNLRLLLVELDDYTQVVDGFKHVVDHNRHAFER